MKKTIEKAEVIMRTVAERGLSGPVGITTSDSGKIGVKFRYSVSAVFFSGLKEALEYIANYDLYEE